jgi:putative nucleotidyltransferase with HDIG domain
MADGPIVLPDGRVDMGVRAHSRRVATWSSELGRALGLDATERALAEQAALYHHIPEVLLDDQARGRLLADLGCQESGDRSLIPEEVRQILLTLSGRRDISDPSIAKMVAVLEISDDFDQFFEAQPLFDQDKLDPCANSSVETMMSYLQVTSRADVTRVLDRLPIFPRAARQVVKQVSRLDVTVHDLESVSSLDPVLAGRLIQTANSAYYSPMHPIASIQHAIAYLGIEATRQILLAATIRASFASMRLHHLWNHSLDVAQAAEQLAQRSEIEMDSAEAFLAGLVHDIGRLAFSIMPAAFLERFYRLTDGGCPPVQVERCLSGRSHDEIGAETLAQWKFPEKIAEAVRFHHVPERSTDQLAALLYLAEFCADSEEDLPSYVRFHSACQRTEVPADAILEIGRKDRDNLDALRFAA